jgi:hypothetical protein
MRHRRERHAAQEARVMANPTRRNLKRELQRIYELGEKRTTFRTQNRPASTGYVLDGQWHSEADLERRKLELIPEQPGRPGVPWPEVYLRVLARLANGIPTRLQRVRRRQVLVQWIDQEIRAMGHTVGKRIIETHATILENMLDEAAGRWPRDED